MEQRGSSVPDAASVSTMHIGEVAARTELSLRTLRHYDEVGLLSPTGRTEGGFRLYTEDDVERLLVIRRMKPLGFTLEEMTAAMRDVEAVRAGSDAGAARARLATLREEAATRRERLVRQLGMADEFLGLLDAQLGTQRDG